MKSNRNQKNPRQGFRSKPVVQIDHSAETKGEKTVLKGTGLGPLLHSEHTVHIEKMAIGGDGIARIPFGDKNVVVFVPKSAPADLLKILVTRIEKSFVFGEIIEIIKPGPHRRVPPCPYATACGGCAWQQIDEVEQLNQKELLLKELFAKFLPEVDYRLLPTVATEHKFEYRNRIQLKRFENKLGYFRSNSHDIVAINDCLIAEPPLRQIIGLLGETLPQTTVLQKYELRINQDEKVEHYRIGAEGEGLSFSQVNRHVNELLQAECLKIVKNYNPLFLTELYAGAGNFTFPTLQSLPDIQIEAVELNGQLTTAATEIVKQRRLTKRVQFFTTRAEIFCRNRQLSKEFILLDPPRSGCHPDVIEMISKFSPENILYISCQPTMLVRDLADLFKMNPLYRLQHLQIFDMFPQTDHFETLCFLTRTG